ncbi:cobalt-zinc-cadmium efflux system membrane fusion protein [Sphingomonas jejuensis]|uniref:Cobalt-zinc-cadmium efflux system membrane fusion protein n=1 Tax=Sphingomonas jejuensis TaxID=904715 RepID=A0ABX0XIM4_9SPHN|nr:cobalt-zinc-cadmium efflux system membrane fusion protein [Sphingomonas jejuensis]
MAALGVGFSAARLTEQSPVRAEAEEHAEGEEHAEESAAPGFVQLTPTAAAAAGVQLASLERGGGSELVLPGRVAFAPGAQSVVGAPLGGTVSQVHVAAGTRVGPGAALATVRSAEGAVTRASLDSARASAEAARTVEARERRLLDAGVVARQDWEAARAASLRAQADVRAAQAQTAALGSPGSNGIAVIRSPIGGVVTRVAVSPGSVVAQAGDVAEIANTARVELIFDAPPASLGLIVVGAPVQARQPDGEVINAVITASAPGAAGGGATVRARPTGRVPPPGTIVSARISGGGGGLLTVPSEAVQTIDGVPSVFVAEPNGFRARPVVTGLVAAGRTEIVRGLSGTERVAGQGAFLLKAELAKGEAEHGH